MPVRSNFLEFDSPEADLTNIRGNLDRWYAFAAERLLVGQALRLVISHLRLQMLTKRVQIDRKPFGLRLVRVRLLGFEMYLNFDIWDLSDTSLAAAYPRP